MDYKKQYENLIVSRRLINRSKNDGVYYEYHHIVPKSWGGSNNEDNMILLTAREHYISHWLLYRMRPQSNGASFAFWKMTFPGGKFVERNYKISSRAYEEAKLAMSSAHKRNKIGYKVSEEHLIKWTKNKNNSKEVINLKTGETYSNFKELWKDKFEVYITYPTFNYYLRKKIKGSNRENRTLG